MGRILQPRCAAVAALGYAAHASVNLRGGSAGLRGWECGCVLQAGQKRRGAASCDVSHMHAARTAAMCGGIRGMVPSRHCK